MTIVKLEGTTAIVTGASRGFGRATAIALAGSGAHVVGVARSEAGLEELHEQLGDGFTPVIADMADPNLPDRLLAQYRPRTLVLNAGATPNAAPLSQQTWESFSTNLEKMCGMFFKFVREALFLPLEPGSTVISLSSGAAVRGSPLSGGYAGAKAVIKFISSYAGLEAERKSLAIGFVSLLPQITAATDLGAPFVAANAQFSGLSQKEYLAQLGPSLSVEDVANSIIALVTESDCSATAYLLNGKGLHSLD